MTVATRTAPAGMGVDITHIVKQYQQSQAAKIMPDLSSLPQQNLKGAMEFILARGLYGINFYFSDLNTSAKGPDLLKILLDAKFDLTQATTAVYYLLTQLQSGRTPDPNDNMVHITLDDLRKASNNQNLAASLYAKIKDGKPDKLLTRSQGLPPPVAPHLSNNPGRIEVSAVSGGTAPGSVTDNVVHQPVELLTSVLGGYLKASDIKAACQIVLKGASNG